MRTRWGQLRFASGKRLAWLALALLPAVSAGHADHWPTRPYSVLYAPDWKPMDAGGRPLADGRFLHDFSYAGYRGGAPLPEKAGPVFNVRTDLRFGADNGFGPDRYDAPDATVPIQRAIDHACSRGGGVVYLPAGTYRVRPPADALAALRLHCSGVVLRGERDAAGTLLTRVINDEQNMRFKRVIAVGPSLDNGYWYDHPQSAKVPLATSVSLPTRVLTLASVAPFRVGQPVIIETEVKAAFRAAHAMGPGESGCPDNGVGCWPSKDARGEILYRKVVAVDPATNTISIDIPTRYLLDPGRNGNNPRVFVAPPFISDVGVEHLLIGMRENAKPYADDDHFSSEGTAGYEMHSSTVLRFIGVADGWANNVRTFRPFMNKKNVHILSNGISTGQSRGITVRDCHIGFPQYQGGGGNGYLYIISGNDSLLQNSVGESGRHNFLFHGLSSSGNVIVGGSSIGGRLVSDTHAYLTRANLIDGMTMRGNHWTMHNRGPQSNGAGSTATGNVFWNIVNDNAQSDKPLIHSAQSGWGYVIGTRGRAARVSNDISTHSGAGTQPPDWLEAINRGNALRPRSLYQDQRMRRVALGT